MAVLALLFSTGEVEANKVKQKEDMPIIILGDPSRQMMGLEQPWSNARGAFFSRGYPEHEAPEVVPVVMAINGDGGDVFDQYPQRYNHHQMHAYRPDMFLIAEPRANPEPEQPRHFEPSMHHDFFSDTFGQDMARSMENMEREMQNQMRSMDEMHKQMEERFKMDFGKPMPSLQKKDANASKTASPHKIKSNLTNIGANSTTHAAPAAPAMKDFASSEFSNSETTTEYDAKTGQYHIEKCVNGKCEKYSQFKNGTIVAQTNKTATPTVQKAKANTTTKANTTIKANATANSTTLNKKANSTSFNKKKTSLMQHNQTTNATVNQSATANQTAAANLTAIPAAANQTANATAQAAPSSNATLAHADGGDDKKEGDKKEDDEKKKKEEDEKAKKEIEEKLKELQKYKDAEEAAKQAEEKRVKLKKKQEEIKKISEDAVHEAKMKSAEEKKAFWKEKAASIKNATEMEKLEKEQDEKDYKEMKKITPGVTAKTIEKVKEDMQANQTARDARIKEYNKKVLRATPKYRAPEPEVKAEDKDPSKALSDAAVEEMKALRKNGVEEEDPKKQLTAQLPPKKQIT